MWRKSQRRRQNPRAAPPKSPVHSTALLVPTMFRRQSSATKSWLVLKCNFLAGFEAQSDSQGDVIDLWSALHQLSLREAALDLMHTFDLEPTPATEKRHG